MDILWGAGILLSLAGGYLLILAVCAILGLLLSIPAMIVGGLQRAPTWGRAGSAPKWQKRAEVPPAPPAVGWEAKLMIILPVIAVLIIAILALVWVR